MSARERAHREAGRTDLSAIASRLQEILGQRLAAFAVGIKDPRVIGRYARGAMIPRSETEERLRQLYEITQVLLTRETPDTARAWLLGANPLLNDSAPIELLHYADQPMHHGVELDFGRGYESVISLAEDYVRA